MSIFFKIVAGLSVVSLIFGCSNNDALSIPSEGLTKTTEALTIGSNSYCTSTYDRYYKDTYVFVTGSDNNLYYKFNQDQIGNWYPNWIAAPVGSITGMVTSVYINYKMFVLSRSPHTNQLKYIHTTDWEDWSDWIVTGPQFSGDIRVEPFWYGSGFRVIVKNSSDNSLWTNKYFNEWGTWMQIPSCPPVANKFDLQFMGSMTNLPLINEKAIVITRVPYRGLEFIYAIALSNSFEDEWTYWVPFSTDNNIGDLAMATNEDGRVEVFAIHDDYSLWHRYQIDLTIPSNSNPIGNWSNWEPLTAPNTCKGQLTAVTTPDKRIEVFFNSYTNGNIRHIYQTAPNSGWSAACDFENGTVQTEKPIAVAPYPGNNRLTLFSVNSSNTAINYSQQHSDTEWWWDPFAAFGL